MGKATNPGIKVIAPTNEEIKNPSNPLFSPMYKAIVFSGMKTTKKPKRKMMVKKGGNKTMKLFQALRRASAVFFLSLKKEIPRRINTIT